jgi:hypothetical protein
MVVKKNKFKIISKLITFLLIFILFILSINADEFSFAVFGDMQSSSCSDNGYIVSQINSMDSSDADFFISTGDLIAGYSEASCFANDGSCTTVGRTGNVKYNLRNILDKIPPTGLDSSFFLAVGNHDDNWGSNWYPDPCDGGICDLIDPHLFVNHDFDHGDPCSLDESQSGHSSDWYYSFEYENSHFIVLRINYDYYDFFTANNKPQDYCKDSPRTEQLYDECWNLYQYDWLVNDLEIASNNPDIENIFLFMHAPVYTSSENHAPPPASADVADLCDEYGVKALFNGHNHAYERTVPIKGGQEDSGGTVYITVGPAGAKTDTINPNPLTAASYRDFTTYGDQEGMSGYMYITVSDDGTISGERRGIGDVVQDSFVIGESESSSESTVHVATNGNDNTGDGGINNPYETIQKGADELNTEKNHLIIHEGTYYLTEAINFYEKPGTVDKPYIITGIDAVIDGTNLGQGNRYQDTPLLIQFSENYIVEDLEIKNCGYHCLMVSWSNNVIMRNNHIHDSYTYAVSVGYSDDTEFYDNEVHSTKSSHCVYYANSLDNSHIHDNQIYDCYSACFQNNADPRLRWCSESYNYNWGDSICDGTTTNLLFENNILHDCHNGAAINLASVSDSIFRNNLVYNAESGGIAMWDDWEKGDPDTYPDYVINAYGCKNNLVTNNIVFKKEGNVRMSMSLKRGSTENTIINNMFVGGTKNFIKFDNSSFDQELVDYNIYYRTDSNDIGQIDYVDGDGDDISEEYFTLQEWQERFNIDLNSKRISIDELFVDHANDNYYHKELSEAIDGGINSNAPNEDLLGISRPFGNNIDIGCYEYTGEIPCTPMTKSEMNSEITKYLSGNINSITLINKIIEWKNEC